jgi:hypothetical protein
MWHESAPRQDKQVSDELGDMIGLRPMAQRVVTDWATAGKGRALWIVGNQKYKVQTIRTERELQLIDTNQTITAHIAAADIGAAVSGHRGTPT